jgi:hypothetical protein
MIKMGKTFKHILHLYVKPCYEDDVEKIKEILNREGKSLSDWVMERISIYVSGHWPGNPQKPITEYSELMELPKRVCVNCGFATTDKSLMGKHIISKPGHSWVWEHSKQNPWEEEDG